MNPETIGRYQVIAKLGQGGMASVYRAHDPHFERDVAVKVLPRELLYDEMFRARFEREARTIASLEHSAIVPVHDYGEDNGLLYLVMRLMPAGSLADRIRERGAMPLAETADIVRRIGSALDMAHKRHIVHRDIKPANILFDQHGEAFLSDFGIVKLTESTAELTGTGTVGTPAYMAPELASPGGLTTLVDIYALGITLYQMLTGQLPFEADTPMGLLMAHVTKPIPSIHALRPDLPDAMQGVIEGAMAKDPMDRYATAGALSADLQSMARLSEQAVTLAQQVPTLIEPPTFEERDTPPGAATPFAPLPVGVAESPSPSATVIEAPAREEAQTPPAPIRAPTPVAPGRARRRRSILPLVLAVVVLAGIAAAIFILRAIQPHVPTFASTPVHINAVPGDDVEPAYSPNGWLAFASNRDGDYDLYVLKQEGGQPVRIGNAPGDDREPYYSPNGWLAFASNRDGDYDVYVLQQEGGQPVQVTNAPGDDRQPMYAANGWLTFASNRDGDTDIYVLKQEGGEPVRAVDSAGDDVDPFYAPNGWLAFASNRDGDYDIYVLKQEGGRAIQVTNAPGDDRQPFYWPGTGDLVFSSNRDGDYDLYVLAANGDLTRLTRKPGDDLDATVPPGANFLTYAAQAGTTGMDLLALTAKP